MKWLKKLVYKYSLKLLNWSKPPIPTFDLTNFPSSPNHVWALGSADPVASKTYSSFSGVDTRVYLLDSPLAPDDLFESIKNKTLEDKVFGTAQAVSWIIEPGRNRATGTLLCLVLNSTRVPDLLNKYIVLAAANEYGKRSVLQAFQITSVQSVVGGMGIDDIVLEQRINWTGTYCPELTS